MAKKTVAGYRDKSKAKAFTKVIMFKRNEKTGSYSSSEEIVPSDQVKEYVKDNK